MDDILYSINEAFERNGIFVTEKKINQFKTYLDFLIEYNEKVNLTAITKPEEIIDMHFVDSLSARSLNELTENAKCADIGTGAGFPGVPLAIVRDDISVALVDSLQKRLVFLNELKEKIGLTNVYTVHGRSEDLGRSTDMRERFDCVFSRAVARLNVLCELDIPFVKKDGYMLAWKGPAFNEEITEAENALKTLNCHVEKIYTSGLEDRQHFVISIKKDKLTSNKYPRQAGLPKKKPL